MINVLEVLDTSYEHFFDSYINKFFDTFNLPYQYGVPILVILVVAVALLLGAITVKKILLKKPRSFIENKRDEEIEKTKTYVFNEYVKILQYISDFKFQEIGRSINPTIVNNYIDKMSELREKGYKRIMSDFNNVYCSINYVRKIEDKEVIEALLTIELRDYVVDANDNVVAGSKNLVRRTISLMLERETICPRCGADIDYSSNICLYCRATLSIDDHYSTLVKEKIVK